jgi:hypothetical protein
MAVIMSYLPPVIAQNDYVFQARLFTPMQTSDRKWQTPCDTARKLACRHPRLGVRVATGEVVPDASFGRAILFLLICGSHVCVRCTALVCVLFAENENLPFRGGVQSEARRAWELFLHIQPAISQNTGISKHTGGIVQDLLRLREGV